MALASVVQLAEASSGNAERLWVRSPVRACARGTNPCFSFILMFLSLSLPLFLKAMKKKIPG